MEIENRMLLKSTKSAVLLIVLSLVGCATKDDDRALNEPASSNIPDSPGDAELIPPGPTPEQADILPAEVDPEPDLPVLAPEPKKEKKKVDKKSKKKKPESK